MTAQLRATGGTGWLIAGLLLGAVAPFTTVVIMPTNRRLLAPRNTASSETHDLPVKWARLHAVRSVLFAAVVMAMCPLAR